MLTADKVEFKYETYSYEYTEPLRKNRAHCMECGSSLLERTGWYTPDFFLKGGTIIEAKGRWVAADRRKMLAVIAQWPDERFCMLFMRDNPIRKGSSTHYSDFCMANNIDFAIGQPDKGWYK